MASNCLILPAIASSLRNSLVEKTRSTCWLKQKVSYMRSLMACRVHSSLANLMPARWTWTPLEVIGHMVDFDIGFAFRIRSVLCDDKPTLTGYDQDKWVAGQKYNDYEVEELIGRFAFLRE